MNVEYNIVITNKSTNTTSVEIINDKKEFNRMWKDADNRLKRSIDIFFMNFIKNI